MDVAATVHIPYRSILGISTHGRLNTALFFSMLTQDVNNYYVFMHGSGYIHPLKFGIWALTHEWALAQDTMVYVHVALKFRKGGGGGPPHTHRTRGGGGGGGDSHIHIGPRGSGLIM